MLINTLLASFALMSGLVAAPAVWPDAASGPEPSTQALMDTDEAPSPLFQRAMLDVGAAAQRVRAIATDQSGFVWLATPSGLVRWDGSHADIYHAHASSAPALPRSSVTDVVDAEGPGVWVGAGTLVHLDPVTLEVTDTTIPAHQIAAGPDSVWALGQSGLVRYEPRSGRSDYVSAADLWRTDGFHNHLQLDSSGTLHVATDRGLHTFDRQGREREITLPGGARGLAGGSAMWVTSPDGLWRLEPGADGRPQQVATIAELAGVVDGSPSPQASAGLVEHQGHLWIGLTDGSVARYSIESGRSLLVEADQAGWTGADEHRTIAVGPSGALLVAASGVGLFQSIQPDTQVVLMTGEDPARLTDVMGVGDQLWLATDDQGLVVIDATGPDWTELDSHHLGSVAEHTSILGIVEGPNGFWIGTPGAGLFSFSESTGQFVSIVGTEGARTQAIAEWSDGGLVAVMQGTQVRAYDGRGRLAHEIDMAQFHRGDDWGPRFVFGRPDGLVWVGGEHGLDLIDPAAGTTRRWSYEQGMVGAEVFDLFEDGQGFVWLATSAGVERIHLDSGMLTHYGTETGLPPGGVSLLVPHPRRDALWAATSEGLALFDLTSEHVALLIDLGLSSAARFIDAYVAEDGTSFVATTDGLIRIAADFPGTRDLERSAHVVSLVVDGVPQPLDGTAEVDSSSTLEFSFGFGEYTRPGALTYQYRLDGHDEHWQDLRLGARSVTYSELDPGSHRISARARTAAGTSATDTYEFTIDRRFPLWVPVVIGAFVAAIAAAFAMTWRKNRDAASRASELELLVAERTHELAEAASVAAQANDSKSQFLAMISHELRTPLNAMMGFTDLIVERAGPGQIAAWADRVQQASEQLESMVEELLFVAHQGDLADTAPPVARDLQRLVDSAVARVRAEAGDDAPPVGVQVRTSGSYFVGEAQVIRVLINLLNNAFRYGGGSPGLVEVERVDDHTMGEPDSDEELHDLIRFSVTDWGPGMASEQVETLLKPFVRGSEDGAGLGLGLAICSQILDRMGSSLQVRTSPGGPTCIWFDLLLRSIPDAASIDSHARVVDDPILVVDDDPHCRELLVDTLEASGFRPVAASSGPEAIALLDTITPKMLVTDHLMPGMIGADLASAVREVKGQQHLRVVCVTAMPEDAAAHDEYDQVLAKPYRPRDLVGAVSDLLAVAS